ncbi:vomeronasal type-2 receptor 26-like [Pelodytes ibericus]
MVEKQSKSGSQRSSEVKIESQVRSTEIRKVKQNSQVPRSHCTDNCQPGYRKVSKSGAQVCCYDCTECPEGEISNRTDSENCIKCPYNEWPNEKKDQCIPRLEEFLSYNNDTIAIIFSFISVLFLLISFVILVIFIVSRDTPIVKANNKSLSFLLLVSIMLSFPCVFLFLGRPVDITCILRQTTFAVIFSIAISSVLGKTVMIYIVFKASKPGSVWSNWISKKVSSSVVLIFSSVQVIINICWLTVTPPFQELDIMSYPGKMIIQCNEGSVIAFYTVLGYMGFLAAVSFIIAYLARTLPNSFNEAKYITFSMLVFCSVWIAMIPAYLSTKGKDMVAAEIFAILTSSAGLLGCIFIPKCYMIVFRPEMNTKSYLLRDNNKNKFMVHRLVDNGKKSTTPEQIGEAVGDYYAIVNDLLRVGKFTKTMKDYLMKCNLQHITNGKAQKLKMTEGIEYSTLWCTYKAVIQGHFIKMGIQAKKKAGTNLTDLYITLYHLNNENTCAPNNLLQGKISDVREKINLQLRNRADRELKAPNTRRYYKGNRTDSLLSSQLKNKRTRNNITKIVYKDRTCLAPNEIGQAFYGGLYNLPKEAR